MGNIIGCGIWIFIIIAFIFVDEDWVWTVGGILGVFILISGLFFGGGSKYGNDGQN